MLAKKLPEGVDFSRTYSEIKEKTSPIVNSRLSVKLTSNSSQATTITDSEPFVSKQINSIKPRSISIKPNK